ncbi:MAG: tetratricopeptide repeat protein [Bacteroidia bacterium]|nr:tetratricopeptide repeat protein [Bacteroidia bacterium]
MKAYAGLLAGLALLAMLGPGCSSERNTVVAVGYHNLTAHYNGYYYALEEITKIENSIIAGQVDDYNRILRLFPALDSTMAKTYAKEAEEAVKMASLVIQHHQNSKWVDDAYILVGRARLYTVDWGNAVQTFKYVNGKSKDADARHRAVINLIRTFIEHAEYNNALAAMDFLSKEEKMSNENRKDLFLQKAYYYQVLEDYDNMIRNLTEATPLLTRKDRRGRIYFIIGQVYQELGFESEAYNFYRRCLSTNPEYEVDFYARLYMAQVAEISRSRSIAAARKSFRKLLKDSKNKEFRDKIFYEMGTFELKQRNLDQAVANFNHAIREGNNKRIDGEAYLKLGEIYYDTLKDYELSQLYYDSAIGALPTDFENYAAIKHRQEVLSEFVQQLKTIQWQDSLLSMASLDSAALKAQIDSVFAEKKRIEEAAAKKKKRRAARVEIAATNTNVFDTGTETDEKGSWYFGNPSAVGLGENEFKRVWGNIPLEDNWRRSLRISSPTAATANPAATNTEVVANGETPEVQVDPAVAEYQRISQQIPRTEEQKKAALKKIEDAYFKLGDIYYFDLEEKDNAVTAYQKLLERFPGSEYEPEALYKLYLLLKDVNGSEADRYAAALKEKHPNSTFTKILLNPDYLQESSLTAEKQKTVYQSAYQQFQSKNYREAQRLLTEAESMGQTSFSPNIDLLKVLIIGETEDIGIYQEALNEFIAANPDAEVTDYAKKLLETSQQFQKSIDSSKEIKYLPVDNGVHSFVILYDKSENMVNATSRVLDDFNKNLLQELCAKDVEHHSYRRLPHHHGIGHPV